MCVRLYSFQSWGDSNKQQGLWTQQIHTTVTYYFLIPENNVFCPLPLLYSLLFILWRVFFTCVGFSFNFSANSETDFGDSPTIVCSILRSNSSSKLSLAILWRRLTINCFKALRSFSRESRLEKSDSSCRYSSILWFSIEKASSERQIVRLKEELSR